MATMQFNDEFVAKKLSELLELGIGRRFISGEQIEAVTKILELDGDTLEGLIAKRNSVVKLLTGEHGSDKEWDTMSGVTSVIDRRLMGIK